MKKNIFSLILAALALLFVGTACEKEFDTQLNHELSPDTDISQWLPVIEYGAVKLGSFNVLYGAYSDNEDYKWNVRKTVLAEAIVANDFDIVGLQEVDKTVRQQLPGLISAALPQGSTRNYQYWFMNRDKQNADAEESLNAVGEGLGVMWDANKFTISEQHYYWLSPTPDVMSTGWDETGYRRIACCAVFTSVQDPTKQFFLTVTHAPLGQTARTNSAGILNSREAQYNATGLASFLVGDMNCTPEEDPAKTLVGTLGWKDAFSEVPVSAKVGGTITFHSKKEITDTTDPTQRIDYIFYRNKPEVLTYKVDYNKYGGYYPSDHCPISVTFNIPNPEKPVPAGISGAGTEVNPFKVANAADWGKVANFINTNGENVDGYVYKLTGDIAFAGDFVRVKTFYGILDGDGHKLTGITGEATAADYGVAEGDPSSDDQKAGGFGGLINVLPDGAVVRNLHVEAILSNAYMNLGGVVGNAKEGSLIDGVTFKGDLTGTANCSRIGGIVGTGYGTIVNCGCLGGNFLAGSATKSENMGGIAGRIENASGATRPSVMANCYSWLDKIVSSNNNLGGVTGGLGSAAYCVNVYGITADITGGGTYGSCIGYSKIGNIRNVYANEDAAYAGSTKWVANDKQASDWTTCGAALTLANMKAGAVALPSSGEECADFVAALNAGIADWNALVKLDAMTGNKETTPYGVLNKPDVTLREWEFDATTGYPVLKASESTGPAIVTVKIVFKDYADSHSWVTETAYTTVEQSGIVLTAGGNDGTLNGVYNTPSYNDWRFYQARGGKLTISVPAGCSLVSVMFDNYEYKNGGCFYDEKGNPGLNDTELEVTGESAVFVVGSQTGATNGQARILGVTVKYV